MEIQIRYEHQEEKLKKLPLRELALFVLSYEKKSFNSEVSLTFVSDETIATLNEKYRKKEGPTDVLSFEYDGSDEDLAASLGVEPSLIELGDVVIAPDVALQQTKEYGTSFEEEISLLLVHGLLHLCGYDHIDDEEAEQMEALEAKILKEWDKR